MTEAPRPLPWVKASEIYFTPSPSRMYSNNVVWFGTHIGAYNYGAQGEDQWHSADLKPFGVSADAIAAFLTGVLIITHGTSEETADMHLVFRRPGDELCPTVAYVGQTVEASVGNGQRSALGLWVPLANGCLEYSYSINTTGDWPTNSSYGANLSLQAWAR